MLSLVITALANGGYAISLAGSGSRDTGFSRSATATSKDDLNSVLRAKYQIAEKSIEEAVFDLQNASTAVIRL
jgi:hypothetical protein